MEKTGKRGAAGAILALAALAAVCVCVSVCLRVTCITMNLLLGVTGSVAAIKLLDIIHFLNLGAKELSINLNVGVYCYAILSQNFELVVTRSCYFQIRIVVTQRALHFLQPITDFDPITVYTDDDEWEQWKTKGDPVLHIEVRQQLGNALRRL